MKFLLYVATAAIGVALLAETWFPALIVAGAAYGIRHLIHEALATFIIVFSPPEQRGEDENDCEDAGRLKGYG